jgi:DNA-binding LytR/AlgR family response regulator
MNANRERIRVLIVDDEKLVRDYLKRTLLTRVDVDVIGEAGDGREAISLVFELSPDVMLLDIQMPELDGFGVLDFLDVPPPTIFVTAYDEYAIKAFEANAIDYLLKPITQERLFNAIDKAKLFIKRKELWESEVGRILNYVRSQSISKIALKTKDGFILLDVEDIYWAKADGDYATIHTKKDDFFYRKGLNYLEARLPSNLFLRVHRSYIVNLRKVTEVFSFFGGTYKLKMSDNAEIPVARRRAKNLKKILGV